LEDFYSLWYCRIRNQLPHCSFADVSHYFACELDRKVGSAGKNPRRGCIKGADPTGKLMMNALFQLI
jgi:hypothetical protein